MRRPKKSAVKVETYKPSSIEDWAEKRKREDLRPAGLHQIDGPQWVDIVWLVCKDGTKRPFAKYN